MEKSKLTPEVYITSETRYLIKLNGDELAFSTSEKEAQIILDSIASYEEKRLQTKHNEIYRRDLSSSKVTLSEKKKGFIFDGELKEVMTIEYTPVKYVFPTKSRFELYNSHDSYVIPSSLDNEIQYESE